MDRKLETQGMQEICVEFKYLQGAVEGQKVILPVCLQMAKTKTEKNKDDL